MKESSIFDVLSIDRDEVHWEDYLYRLTPVESHTDDRLHVTMYFKREDYFAPLGYGGVNGAKMRQMVYLGSEYIQNSPGRYVVNGTSVHSPQLLMVPAVARHYGKKNLSVIGATGPESAMHNHDMVRGGAWIGAEYDCTSRLAYNSVLQRRCLELQKELGDGSYYLEYGITLGLQHTDEEIYRFHCVGAEQVRSIPEDVHTIIMAAGSCNSCTSVLLGIALFPPPGLKRILLVGTGPSKIDYLTERLERMKTPAGTETRLFDGLPYHQNLWDPVPSRFPYSVVFFDTYGTRWCTYDDLIPFSFDDIVLHPRYEGKVATYAFRYLTDYIDEHTLFWIVGSEPSIEPMREHMSGDDSGVMHLYQRNGE